MRFDRRLAVIAAAAVVLAAGGVGIAEAVSSSEEPVTGPAADRAAAAAVKAAGGGSVTEIERQDGDGAGVGEELAEARQGSSMSAERNGFRLRADPVDDRVVVVGKALEDRDEALAALLAQLLVALPLARLVSSIIGYLVAGAALRPVEAMRVEADAISASEPDRRLPLPAARDEIYRLGETLNEMLDRLGSALERERAFVADASHELRTPLALLKAELELATRRPRTPDELQRAVRSAVHETDRLVQLAEDLLLVARADRGKLALQPSRVSVTDLFAGVSRRFEARARTAGREIVYEASPKLELEGDEARLTQALGNMVDNALSHGAGSILLRAGVRDGMVELHVVDEGEGFPPGFVERAFERFTRADVARGDGGTGLGLAIVDAIARAHGGNAQAVNQDGRGADVWISIPRG